jgi:cytochrome c oxidase cbb3-type subunit I/II
MRVLKKLGVPYTDEQIQGSVADYKRQADAIVKNLAGLGKPDAVADREIIAMIAYLLRLGRNLMPADAQGVSVQGGR